IIPIDCGGTRVQKEGHCDSREYALEYVKHGIHLFVPASQDGPLQLTAGCLSSQVLNQFLQRGRPKNSRELRSIISNSADVIDNRIVDHPLSTCEMDLVCDFDRSAPAANNPRVDFRRFSV